MFISRPPPRYKVNLVDNNVENMDFDGLPRWHHTGSFAARLIRNDRVTAPDHFQDVRLVRLDITGSEIRYVKLNFWPMSLHFHLLGFNILD